mgnify:CR=1 FL=1|jgi:hypothetical protein
MTAPEDTFAGNTYNFFERLWFTICVIAFVAVMAFAITVRLICNIWAIR